MKMRADKYRDQRGKAPSDAPVKRGAGGKWLPGTPPPNPSGRPKDTFRLAARCREYGDECLDFLLGVMRGEYAHEGAQFRDRMLATQELLNRGHGRPSQALTVTGGTGEDEGPVRFTLQVGRTDGPEDRDGDDV